MSTRAVGIAVVIAMIAPAMVVAVGGNKAQYLGGTVTTVQEKDEGVMSTADPTVLHFRTSRGSLEIPYAAITELEYGQKAGRRVAVAVMVSPLALFSKKRNHYLTITYKDAAGQEQAAVFELGKDIVRTTLKVIETRSGKDVTYQDDEARRSLGGGK